MITIVRVTYRDKKYNNYEFSVEIYERLIKYYWDKGYIKNFIKTRQ